MSISFLAKKVIVTAILLKKKEKAEISKEVLHHNGIFLYNANTFFDFY